MVGWIVAGLLALALLASAAIVGHRWREAARQLKEIEAERDAARARAERAKADVARLAAALRAHVSDGEVVVAAFREQLSSLDAALAKDIEGLKGLRPEAAALFQVIDPAIAADLLEDRKKRFERYRDMLVRAGAEIDGFIAVAEGDLTAVRDLSERLGRLRPALVAVATASISAVIEKVDYEAAQAQWEALKIAHEKAEVSSYQKMRDHLAVSRARIMAGTPPNPKTAGAEAPLNDES